MSADQRLTVGQVVSLRHALPGTGLARGAVGAVVMVYARPRLAYEAEFVGDDGETKALVTLRPEEIISTGATASA